MEPKARTLKSTKDHLAALLTEVKSLPFVNSSKVKTLLAVAALVGAALAI